MARERIPTWTLELLAVALVLGPVWSATGSAWLELVGAVAVLLTFAHAQVADRMTEREARRSRPEVHCWRWSRRYFVAKEVLWFAYFAIHGSWSALVGVVVFLLYPLWRTWYRRVWPLQVHDGP
jgi:hypothetical protein